MWDVFHGVDILLSPDLQLCGMSHVLQFVCLFPPSLIQTVINHRQEHGTADVATF